MPEITITAGILPPPACYASEQERLEAFVAAMSAELSSEQEWSVGQIPPPDTELLWLKLDVDGRPVMAYAYNDADAAWVPWFGFPVSGVSTGAAGAYSLTNSPAFTTTGEAYSVGRTYVFKANHATTGASSLNVDGLGAKAIKIKVTQDTVANTIKTDQIVTVVYDGINFQMISAVGGIDSISVSDIDPGNAGDFLRSRGATPATVWENSLYKTDDADMEAMPAAGDLVSFPHGLGQVPVMGMLIMVCIDADAGFSVGDEVHEIPYDDTKRTVWCDATNVNYRPIDGPTTRITNATTGAETTIDPTKWNLKAWAMK